MKDLLIRINEQIEKFYQNNIDNVVEEINNNELLSKYTPINIVTSIMEDMLSDLNEEDNESIKKSMDFIAENLFNNENMIDKLSSIDSYYSIGVSLMSLGLTLLNVHEFNNKEKMNEYLKEQQKEKIKKTIYIDEELDEFFKKIREEIEREEIEAELNEDIIDKFNNNKCSKEELFESFFEGEISIKDILERVNKDKLIDLSRQLEKELFPKEYFKIMYY